MKVAVDTNELAYIEGVNGDLRQCLAAGFIQRLAEHDRLIPIQALGELYNVLVRKDGWPADRARTAVLAWRDAFDVAPTTESAIVYALDVRAAHRRSIWDSI